MNSYTPVIGLEIHVELKTKSKIFCQCSADYFGKVPNTNTCPVCLGMPGALPVPNRTAIEWTIKIGQALGCTINKHSKFDRKHYYYPDLPKGYQISQYDEPFAVSGNLMGFGITRVHLEEDTGKLTHAGDDTLVDFNRSSVPLVEIVTEPDFDSVEDVKAFLEELHTIIKYLDVSDANMEEGSMRIEPNISLSVIADKAERMKHLPNYKVEVKNINSFNFAKKAIEYELIRQAGILDAGKTPAQETRGYNEDKKITYSQRSKEEAQDYRYFPEPDIPPIELTDKEIADIKATLPELPAAKRERFMKDFGLKENEVKILVGDRSIADYYESVFSKIKLNRASSDIENIEKLTASAIVNKRISINQSLDEFTEQFIEVYKPVEVDEDKLSSVIASIIENNPKQVEQYKSGKTGLMGFFIGQVMKEMKGQADPQALQKLIIEKLS